MLQVHVSYSKTTPLSAFDGCEWPAYQRSAFNKLRGDKGHDCFVFLRNKKKKLG